MLNLKSGLRHLSNHKWEKFMRAILTLLLLAVAVLSTGAVAQGNAFPPSVGFEELPLAPMKKTELGWTPCGPYFYGFGDRAGAGDTVKMIAFMIVKDGDEIRSLMLTDKLVTVYDATKTIPTIALDPKYDKNDPLAARWIVRVNRKDARAAWKCLPSATVDLNKLLQQ
jgi:hypothetical protein